MKITRTEIRRRKHGRQLTVITLVRGDSEWRADVAVGDPRLHEPLAVDCGKDGSGRALTLHLSHIDALTLIVKLRDAVALLPND